MRADVGEKLSAVQEPNIALAGARPTVVVSVTEKAMFSCKVMRYKGLPIFRVAPQRRVMPGYESEWCGCQPGCNLHAVELARQVLDGS